MKILTVAIPCYNSAEYMEHAIETLLTGGEELEILIINDGSVDDTKEIADKYAYKYPNIVKAIHQENGGHGEAVNTGLRNAQGVFFKVVDSDDWVEEEALLKILDVLRSMVHSNTRLDMLISNYVYEKVSEGKQKVIGYKSCLPEDKLFTWNDVGRFKESQNILMHSVIYRTKMLKNSGIELPKHTFYVDNIFVYQPLPYVKQMYYLNVDFYRYFIGRDDQSVNETVMIGRIDQQIHVNKIMIDAHDITKIGPKRLRQYMVKYLTMIMTVSTALLIKEGSPESMEKKRELWEYLKKNPDFYKAVNHSVLGRAMQMDTKLGRKIILDGYKMSRKIFGFS